MKFNMKTKQIDIPAAEVENYYKTKWRNITLSTTSTETQADDHNAITGLLSKVYAIWGLPAPRIIVWCGSTAAAKIAVGAGMELLRLKRAYRGKNVKWGAIWKPIQKSLISNFSDIIKIAPVLPFSVEESLRHAFYDEHLDNFVNIEDIVADCKRITFQNTKQIKKGILATEHGLYIGDWHKHELFDDKIFQFYMKRFADGWRVPPVDKRLVAHDFIKPLTWLAGGEFTPLCWTGRDMSDILPAIDICREVFEIEKETARLAPFIQLARHTRWAWGKPGIAFIAEPPSVFKTDEHLCLHDDEGAALQFRDGVELHALHGFLVEDPAKKNNRHFSDELLLTKHFGRRATWVDSDDFGDLYYEGVEVQRKRLADEVWRHLEILENESVASCLDSLEKNHLIDCCPPDVSLLEHFASLAAKNPAIPACHAARMEILDVLWDMCCQWIDDWNAHLYVRVSEVCARVKPEDSERPKNYFIQVPPWLRTAHEALAWSLGKSAKAFGKDCLPALFPQAVDPVILNSCTYYFPHFAR